MSIFAQPYLWVFKAREIPGYPNSITQAAAATGHGLIVKVHDGDPADDGTYFVEPWQRLKALCDQAGVPLLAWGYCYGNKYGNLLKEADAVVRALTDLGGAGYVLDVESEWEVPDHENWVQAFAARILSQVPDAKERLAFSPFWNMRWHGQYPAEELATLCSAVMPQCYFGLGERTGYAAQEEMVAIMDEDFGRLGLPVYPVGEFTAAGIRDVATFMSLVGSRPHSWWLLDGYQDSDEVRYLAKLRVQNDGDEAASLRLQLGQATGLIAETQMVLSKLQAFRVPG
jgi:hypothetical protein